jgi:hypothetical protein
MDRLTAFVCIAHLRLRLDILKRNPHLLDTAAMTPKLQGVLQSFNLLKHNLEADADDLAKRIQDADQRRVALKQNSHAALGKVGSDMGDIEDFLGAMEGTNGAPLESSSASSPPSSDAPADAAPERLTVNGVSQS